MNTLTKIQVELKAPKNQYNAYGKYNYRNCEDILEAVKPLLAKYNADLTISDTVHEIAGIPYVEACATFRSDDFEATVEAQAGIDPNRKGMDLAQSFGASSSYARKYALNGLFLIDDTKDPDSTNKGDSKPSAKPQAQAKPQAKADDDGKKWLNATSKDGKLNKTGEYTASKLASGDTTWQTIYKTHKVSKSDKQAIEARASELVEELSDTPF